MRVISGLARQLDDVLGKLAGGDVGDRHLLEHRAMLARSATRTSRGVVGLRGGAQGVSIVPVMSGPPYTGHCLCGGVRFEVTDRPESAGYCHCTRCQRRTGGASSAQARLRRGSFRLLAGEELVREYAPADGWPKCFCSVCGSALWSTYPETGEVGSVRLGLFDPGHDIRPQWRSFVNYACEWEPIPADGLERFPEGKPR